MQAAMIDFVADVVTQAGIDGKVCGKENKPPESSYNHAHELYANAVAST